MRSIFSLVIVFGLACTQSFADSVVFTLEYETSSNTFELFADASLGDNFGLAIYGVPLQGSILTFNHRSPRATVTDFSFVNDGD